MKRMVRALRTVLRHLKDTRGVSLYEITAAVAMTGILAAVAVPVIIEQTTAAKVSRVNLEVTNISDAISNFKKDTGKVPGQAESLKVLLSGPIINGTVHFALLPAGAGTTFTIPGVNFANNCTGANSGCGNLNSYLVKDPNVAFGAGKYPNWKGPYIEEIFIDQFDRAYIVNVAALYKKEASSPGSCGFAWAISGGPDRTLQTAVSANSTPVDLNGIPTSDDIGKNNGKALGGTETCS